MNTKTSLILLMVLISTAPLSAGSKKKDVERGMVEKMDAVPCGAKERGLNGLGTVWASAGITHVNSDEKLCQQYLLRTDQNDYEIRPTDDKHPVILTIGQEGEFKIKKDHMFLTMTEGGDRKTRTYQVVEIKPSNPDADPQKQSSMSSDTH